jgi:hypothetical protein
LNRSDGGDVLSRRISSRSTTACVVDSIALSAAATVVFPAPTVPFRKMLPTVHYYILSARLWQTLILIWRSPGS